MPVIVTSALVVYSVILLCSPDIFPTKISYLQYSLILSAHLQHNYTIFSLGDQAITIDFGGLSPDTNKLVLLLFHHLKTSGIDGVKDVIPAYSSLTIVYDPIKIYQSKSTSSGFDYMKQKLEESLKTIDLSTVNNHVRKIEIPVCYDISVAPDIEFVASSHNIGADEVISIHTSGIYRVYMIGFLPGFAYMASVDTRIATPRKPQPRKLVPAGSVGIAGEQTGVYPLNSPGGWQLIGRTPLQLFDASKDEPTLFQPGDEVKFYSISLAQYNQLKES
jgi:inhibitor of KinA